MQRLAMSYYYYYAANNAPSIWFIPPLFIGLGVIALSVLIGFPRVKSVLRPGMPVGSRLLLLGVDPDTIPGAE